MIYHLVLRRQPPLALPLEVIAIIAGFVAGSNAYATLASLAATSKLLKQECEPVLWETLIWCEKLGQDVVGNKIQEQLRQHVKYVVSRLTESSKLPENIGSDMSIAASGFSLWKSPTCQREEIWARPFRVSGCSCSTYILGVDMQMSLTSQSTLQPWMSSKIQVSLRFHHCCNAIIFGTRRVNSRVAAGFSMLQESGCKTLLV